MHESRKRDDARKFVHESLISTTKDISTFIATGETETVILRKTPIPFRSVLQTIVMNPEINNNPHVLKVLDIYAEGDLSTNVLQEHEGFMPLEIFLEAIPDEKILLFVILKIMNILEEGELTKQVDLIGLSNIWINKEASLKICWFSTVLGNLRMFDNEVYKMNVNSLENINKLIALNSKHSKKRMYNFPNNSDDKIAYTTPSQNMFMQQEKSIIFVDAVKAGKRKHGHKKLCIERSEKESPENEETKPVALKMDILKKLISRVLFHKSTISEKDLEAKIKRLTELLKKSEKTPVDLQVDLTSTSLFLLRSLFVEPTNPQALIKFLEKEVDLEGIREGIKKVVGEIFRSEQASARDIFTKNGFNMEGYSTIAYKKGRFQVYEAVPSPSGSKKDHLNDLLRIVDIQNRQIEMIYRTMKDKKSIDKLEDDQLENLSKEINLILQKLTKDE